MEQKPSENPKSKLNYWLVFGIGLIYILLLGLFTYYFNNPV